MNDYIVANFSGGRDSTTMVLRMIELGEHIDEVVCCDTYKEFPAMYRHIDRVKRVVEDVGIKFTILRAEKDFDYYMFEHEAKTRDGRERERGYSWADMRSRWCTVALKTRVIQNYFKTLRKKYRVVQCVGIAADEEYRLARANNQNLDHRHPLVEWRWTEADCLRYCYERGYDWEGLYEIFDRVSCWCCPLKNINELRNLRKHFPELWDELKDMDRRTWRQFRADYSVEELEIRFQLEDEWEAQGLVPNGRTKAFREALKERLDKHREAVSTSN